MEEYNHELVIHVWSSIEPEPNRVINFWVFAINEVSQDGARHFQEEWLQVGPSETKTFELGSSSVSRAL